LSGSYLVDKLGVFDCKCSPHRIIHPTDFSY
jgi:hypothetical protein